VNVIMFPHPVWKNTVCMHNAQIAVVPHLTASLQAYVATIQYSSSVLLDGAPAYHRVVFHTQSRASVAQW
jgi:hypothetical protein